MGIVEIFAEFLALFFGIFAQHRQGTFVLPGRMQLNVDVLVLKKTIDVGDLRHNANRAMIANGALTTLFATQAII